MHQQDHERVSGCSGTVWLEFCYLFQPVGVQVWLLRHRLAGLVLLSSARPLVYSSILIGPSEGVNLAPPGAAALCLGAFCKYIFSTRRQREFIGLAAVEVRTRTQPGQEEYPQGAPSTVR